MKKRISRILGLIMLIIAIAFIVFALNHPEMSFPWNNTITWLLYGVYFLVTVVLLIAPKNEEVRNSRLLGNHRERNRNLTKECDYMGKAILAAIVTLIVGYLGMVVGLELLGNWVEFGLLIAIAVMGAFIIYFNDKK